MPLENPQQRPTGRILKRIGDRYLVFYEGRDIVCAVRQKVAKGDRYPAIGDWVEFSEIGDSSGVIERIHERGSNLTRSAAGPKPRPQVMLANLDLLVVVSSLAEPDPNPRLIDRFLVMAEFSDIPSVIVWNKYDLINADPPMSPPAFAGEGGTVPAKLPEISLPEKYRAIGYPSLFTCALTGQGVEALRDQIAGKTSMFIGASGVGKTSLLNQLSPDLGKKVAEISHATGKGIHTTSSTEIVPLDKNTFIADSPGVREFALWGVARHDLGKCFREFQPFAEQCKFRDCVHDQEVGCGVKQAVESGGIDRERWESYLRILHTL